MFTKQYRIGTIDDIPLHVSQLWIVVFLIATYTISRPAAVGEYMTVLTPFSPIEFTDPLFNSSIGFITFAAAVVLTLYTSVVLHELGHIYGARKNDVPVAGITLWVLGGAAKIEEQPVEARREFELTIAGPLVSLVLAVTAFALAYVTAPLGIPTLVAYFLLAGFANTGMLLMNLVPAFPLDGGRLLRSALTALLDYKRATTYATRIGKLIAIGVFALSVAHLHIMGVLLSGFVFLAARSENKRVESTMFNNDEPAVTHESINVTGSTFVLETELTTFTLHEITQILTAHNATVGMHAGDTTDYIVIPDGEHGMYRTIASNYDAEIITASTFATHLESLLMETRIASGGNKTGSETPETTDSPAYLN